MAIDKLSLYNKALILLGQEGLEAIDDDRAGRHHLDAVYSLDAVKYCLQIVKPNFARKTAKLTTSTVSNVHDLNRSFSLPSDFVEIVDVYTDSNLDQPLSRYLREANQIQCAYTTIYVRYISSTHEETYTYWTPAFANVVATYLAREASVKIDSSKFEKLDEKFTDRVEIAKTLDLENEPANRASVSTVTLSDDWRTIYNDALMVMGLEEITTNTDDSNRKTKLDRVLDAYLVQDLLEDIGWTFAQKSTKAYYDPSLEPSWGYRHVFKKPDDLGRIKGLFHDEHFQAGIKYYEDEGGNFYCDNDVIYIKYVSTDWLNTPSQWPAFFKRLVAGRMAKDAAKSLKNEGADYDRSEIEYEKRRDSALSNDAISSPPRVIRNGSWVRARTRGGYRNRPGDY
ncbi:MAG: hypothetical protein JAY90_20225 [Candidatus Thiodiazotropha lotti]|nr:hypothetical protein [Candidatus Thiodiazotropha lotti]